MRKWILIFAIWIIFAGTTYGGDLTVNGKVIAPQTFQAGSVNNENKWVLVTFPVPFENIPIVIATPVKVSSTSGHFFVEIRNVTTTGFEFRAVNHDGTGHGNTVDRINWFAFVP